MTLGLIEVKDRKQEIKDSNLHESNSAGSKEASESAYILVQDCYIWLSASPGDRDQGDA